jgi:hypothetical protein
MITVLGQPEQTVYETPILTNNSAQWYTPVIQLQEAEIRRIAVSGQSRQKFARLHFNRKKSWVWWCTSVIPDTLSKGIKLSKLT